MGLLLPVVTAGQGIDVERADLYLRGGRLASGAWGCGFAILANHRTRDDPHVERDISVEQVNNGRSIATAVTAASFTVSHKSRQARAPVTHLSFAIDQDPDPIEVRFESAASDGAVHAALSSEDATRLYAAVDAGSFITLKLDYSDQPSDALRFRFMSEGAAPARGALAQLCTPLPAAHP